MAFIAQAVEGVRIALSALAANLLRTALTILGVVVGISVVIIMGWLLQGLDTAFENTIQIFGNDVLYVDKFDWSGRVEWSEQRNRKDITLSQAEKVQELMASAQSVVPTIRTQGEQVKKGNVRMNNAVIFGTTSDYTDILGENIAEGRFLSPIEDQFQQNVVVIGYALVENLFPHENPIGQTIKIKGRPFTVIGTLKKRATFLIKQVDNQIFIPLQSYLSMYGRNRSITLAVKANSGQQLDAVRDETIGIMRRVRNIAPGDKEDFGVNEAQQFRDQVAVLRTLLWTTGIGLTALSFVVGVIGIVNIMFVAVSERTKEIGVRKALGAPRRAILFQFLVEAATLCLIGAAIAFALCSLAIVIITTSFEQASALPSYIPPHLLLIATAVSIAVGMAAGIVPAFRAAKMDAVMALRTD